MRVKVDVARIKPTLVKLRAVDPAKNPEAVSRALRAMADRVHDISRREELSGPRPRELDRVTGELARSLERNESALPRVITFGTAVDFAPVHEFGKKRRLSFFAPALDKAFPEFGEILERELLAVVDAA